MKMKNIQTFEEFVNESVNEGSISGMKLKALGAKLLTKISIGSQFVTDKDTYTVTDFGPKANAFQEFFVTDSKGNAKKVKLTAMYTIKLEVTDDPRSAVYRREEMLSSINESLNEKIEYPEGVKTTDDKILDKLAKLLNSKTAIIEIGTGSIRGKKVPFMNGEAFFNVTGQRDHWTILCKNGDFDIPRKDIKTAEDLYAQVERAIQMGEVSIGKKK